MLCCGLIPTRKSAWSFLFVTFVRVVSLVAVCLAFASAIMVIYHDVDAYNKSRSGSTAATAAAESSAADSSDSSTPATATATSSAQASSAEDAASASASNELASAIGTTSIEVLNVNNNALLPHGMGLARLAAESPTSSFSSLTASSDTIASTATATAIAASESSPTASQPARRGLRSKREEVTYDGSGAVQSYDASSLMDGQQGYIDDSSVPRHAGGILFAVLLRVLILIILILLFVSELSPPSNIVNRFWDACFPPLGPSFGVGVVGAIEAGVGCQMLAFSATGFTLVSGYLLFSVGCLNLLLGLIYGSRIRALRSLLPDPDPTPARKARHVKRLSLLENAAPMGVAVGSSSAVQPQSPT